GDSAVENHNSLDTLTSHAMALEEHCWKGALIGGIAAMAGFDVVRNIPEKFGIIAHAMLRFCV
ncbi:hypothetical protein, partial [Rhizobium leguminosarum]|uniref:hypothetical protein n=1 Tax=Rhizobium leguminosarum TaxID=384 RepID=UPI003F960636